MYSLIRFVSLPAIVALLSGCGGGGPQMIRVTIQYPGASPKEVADAVAAPLEATLLALPEVDSVTSISSAGRLECYVVIARDRLPDEVARVVAKLPGERFPDEATTPKIELLPATATIPTVSSTDVDYIVVELNRDAAAEHGIPIQNVLSAIEKQAGGNAADMSRLPKLRAVQVTAPDDQAVPLTELAEIRVEKQPSHIVTEAPSRE